MFLKWQKKSRDSQLPPLQTLNRPPAPHCLACPKPHVLIPATLSNTTQGCFLSPGSTHVLQVTLPTGTRASKHLLHPLHHFANQLTGQRLWGRQLRQGESSPHKPKPAAPHNQLDAWGSYWAFLEQEHTNTVFAVDQWRRSRPAWD